MGAALENLREFLKKNGISLDRRSFTSLLVLILMLFLLPVGIYLLKNRTVFMPMAAGELIQLADGGCVKLDKDKKKVVDCPTIPLKLVNPFYSVSGSSSAPSASASIGSSSQPGSSTAASASPSPSASVAAAPQIVRVSGNTSTEIQAALNQIKDTGGAVYVPAGSYTINSKVQLYNNTTLFGDGIDQTIFNAGTEIDAEEAIIGNDTDEGNSNVVIRDMTLRAHALGTGEGIKLRNLTGGFVINVKVERTNTGILLGFHNGRGVNNVRVSGCQMISTVNHGVFVTLGENNVIDNCNNNGNGSDSLGIGLEIAVDGKISGNKIISNTVSNGGHSMSLTAGNDNQYQSGWVNSNNIVCYNNGSGNKIQPIWEQRGSSNVYVGNGLGVVNVENSSFGYEEKGGTDSRCDIPAVYNLPAVPVKPAADASNSFWGKLVGEVFAQDSDDNFTGTTYNDSDDNFTNSPAPTGSGSGSGMVKYRLAESQAGLTSAPYKDLALIPFDQNLASNRGWIKDANAQDSDDQFTSGSSSPASSVTVTTSPGASAAGGPVSTGRPSFSVGKQFINVNYVLSNSNPGAKQVWVQFLHPDGSTRVDHVTFNFVDKLPSITGLSCNLDISKQNLQIKVTGNYFGTTIGKLSAESGGTPEVGSWNDKQIISTIKSSGSKEGQKYKIKVVRSDGFESGYAVCAVDKSLVSLGARLFCREPGKFDATDVTVTLVYGDEANNNNNAKKVEEKVTISKDGEIANLKTQLQAGKNYAISIKAPNSLRRSATFTASEGTSQITRPDGTPFILPVGDIAPIILLDGQINTLDRSELIRQWRVLSKDNTKITGDFNRDGRVNSIDWACMQYDFGSSDDPLPVEVPQPASGNITIPVGSPGASFRPGSGSGTITIPIRSPSPSPSVSSDAGSVIFKEEFIATKVA